MVNKQFEEEAKETFEEVKKDFGAAAVGAEGFFKKHKAVVIGVGLVLIVIFGFFVIL